MNVVCPTCETVYRVDPAKVPLDGVRARCAECAGVIPVPPPGAEARQPGPGTATPATPRSAIPATHAAAARPVSVPSGARRLRVTRPISGRPAPATAPLPTPAPRQPTRPVIVRPGAEELARPEERGPERPSAPVFRPTEGPPMAAPPVPPQEALPVPPKDAPSPPQVRAATGITIETDEDVTEVRPAIQTVEDSAVVEPPASTRGAAVMPPAAAEAEEEKVLEPFVPEGAGRSFQAKPPINPFLSRDPRQKARRLARALVSDMIVYQPEKRQQALMAGTLKESFAEEIRKSWEEYVEQVGEEMADSTPFFTEALNEILAGGQRVF